MPSPPPERELLWLDACTLINLLATGVVCEILDALPFACGTSAIVADREVLALRHAQTPETARSPVFVSRLLLGQKLVVLPVSGEFEQAEFARFSIELDDGEASVCALARARGGCIANDDRRALRLLAGLGIPTRETPDLLYEWAMRAEPSEDEVRAALLAIRDRARFVPRRSSPRFDWWEVHLR